MNVEQIENNRKIMLEYISKYISEEFDPKLFGCILFFDQNKDGFNNLILSFLKNIFQTQMQQKLNFSEPEEGISAEETSKRMLVFLNHLEELYNLFKKKGIETNCFEILTLFTEAIKDKMVKIQSASTNAKASLDKGKEKQKIKVKCPYCEKEIELELNTNDIKAETAFQIKCPYCGTPIIGTPSITYTCNFCSKPFKTKKEAEDHERICDKRPYGMNQKP